MLLLVSGGGGTDAAMSTNRFLPAKRNPPASGAFPRRTLLRHQAKLGEVRCSRHLERTVQSKLSTVGTSSTEWLAVLEAGSEPLSLSELDPHPNCKKIAGFGREGPRIVLMSILGARTNPVNPVSFWQSET